MLIPKWINKMIIWVHVPLNFAKHEASWSSKLRCNLNFRSRNRDFGVHHWHTPKSTSSEHVKREWCETSGKYFRKWLKTSIVIYFGFTMTRNWAFEADIRHTSKSSSNWHVNQDWCETSWQLLRKLPKTAFWPILGSNVAQTLGAWSPHSPDR